MFNKFRKISNLKSSINLLFWFIILQIFSLHFNFTTLAEEPKNYLKGKFYKSVKDHFLVATKKMLDNRFKKTVIVMLDNDEEGSWGLVINKPIGSIPLGLLLGTSQDINNEKKKLYEVEIPIFWGGPVNEKQIYILHSQEYKNETTIRFNGISVSRDYKILFDIAKKKGPKQSLVILGFSGWGSGQLEGEMEIDHWILSELNADIVFKEKSANKWLKAYENSFIRL